MLPMHPGVSHIFCCCDPNSTVSTGRRPGWICPGWIWGRICQFVQSFGFVGGVLPKVEGGLGECEQGESGRRFCQSGQRFSLFQVHSTLGKTSPIYSSLIIIFWIKFSTSLKGSPRKPKNKLLSFPGIACSEIIMSEVPPDEVGRSREPPDPRSSGTWGQGQGHHCLSSLCTISFCETRYNQANLLSVNLFWHVKKETKIPQHTIQTFASYGKLKMKSPHRWVFIFCFSWNLLVKSAASHLGKTW